MGEAFIKKYKDIDRTSKLAFFSTLAIFLLTHFYKLVNFLPNHDTLYTMHSAQNGTASGRWFLSVACFPSSLFDLPWINGLLSAVYLALVSVVIVKLFRVENPVVIMIIGGILTALPPTTETMFFSFTADGFCLGLLLVSVGSYLLCTRNDIWSVVVATVLICLSCGIYQAYVSFGLVMSLCYCCYLILKNEISTVNVFKRALLHVGSYGVAMALYYGLWKLILHFTSAEATGYQGINTVTEVSLSKLIGGAVTSVKNIYFFFFEWNMLEHPITLYGLLNLLFLVSFAGLAVYCIVKCRVYKSPVRLLVFVAALALCVPVVSVWSFFSAELGYHLMMLHSLCFLFIFAAVLADGWLKPRLSTAFGVLLAAIIAVSAVNANIAYFYLNKEYEKSYGRGLMLMSDIRDELVEASGEVTKIAFIGNRSGEVDLGDTYPSQTIHLLAQMIEEDLLYDHVHTHLFLSEIFGLELQPAEELDRLAFERAERENGTLEIWPEIGSMTVVDDTLVIKIGEIEE